MNGKISHLSQVCSLRRYILAEGSEKGLEIIECDNGKIRFLLNVSKALDIAQLWHEGQNISYICKNGLNERDIPFMNRFEGGMLYTCGLDNIGVRVGLEQHGTLHITPAKIIKTVCNEKEIIVVGEVRSSALFGKNLVLTRTITTQIGSDEIKINDVIKNEGYVDGQYCLLYHVNIGYPMLDNGAKIVADVESIVSRSKWAKENEKNMFNIIDCKPVYEEMCYYIKMKKPKVSLVNEKLKKEVVLSWSGDTLPYFNLWKSMASGDYALGLEPCTTEFDDNLVYDKLNASESKSYSITIKIAKI